MLFILVAPYNFKKQTRIENEKKQGISSDDEKLMQKFVNYLARENSDKINKAPAILLISQLDNYNPLRKKEDTDENIARRLMPNICNTLRNEGSLIGGYSVGEVTIVDNLPALRKINDSYPAKLWREMYMIMTGKDLIQEKKKTFWEKIIYFFTGKTA